MSARQQDMFASTPAPLVAVVDLCTGESASDEFYTPRAIVDALPPIDLDPFSPPHRPVPAREHCVGAEGGDGFALVWRGVVFGNPPYSSGNLPRFCRKARFEVESGSASLVIGLIPAKPGAGYWHDHVHGIARVGYVRGRILFHDRAGEPFKDAKGRVQSGKFDSAFVLWSLDADAIARTQSELDARSGLAIYWY
jgi:hypothetical protein